MLCARRAGMLVVTRGEACKCKCKCKMQMSPVDKEKPALSCMSRIKDRDTRLIHACWITKKHYACLRFVESAVSLTALPCPALLSIEGSEEEGLSLVLETSPRQ